MTQAEHILNHIQRYGSINPQQALNHYGCMRLGARIYDLKKAGYNIISQRAEGLNKRGEKCHWAEYRLGTTT